MLWILTAGGSAGAPGFDAGGIQVGILSAAFCVSVSPSISMLLMTLVALISDQRSGVTVTLPTLMSSVLPTVTPRTLT